jgi:N-acetylglucosamine-6-sulfatase
MPMKSRRNLIAATCALALGTTLPIAGSTQVGAAAPDRQPNILVIMTDDQAWSAFTPQLMPNVFEQLVDEGVLFRRAYVNTSLCCPSRAEFLTGLFEHHTGVDGNQVMLTRPTFPEAVHDAGYRTMLAGKYLNSWSCEDVRPEFDRWSCLGEPEPSTYSLIDPYINVDGTWQTFNGYQTDILASQVIDFIDETPAGKPFFALYAPTSPHLPADDPRYDDFSVELPRGPSFNSNTLTPGSPRYTRGTRLTRDEIGIAADRYVRMARVTRSLDDSIGNILASLGNRSDDTLVVFFSDNGYLYGEHRRVGKNDAWEEAVRVPMVVRYPALLPPAGAFASDALVQNVDIASTVADLVGFKWGADGRSFVPLITRQRKSVRDAALIEHCRGEVSGSLQCTGLSFDGGRTQAPGYQGIVTSRYKYVEYDDGSTQLLDLKKDPAELRNLAGVSRLGAVRRQLAGRLDNLMTAAPLETTIVTGPGPTLSSRVAVFTFFSPSRLATYRCRLVRNGAPGAWHSCQRGLEAFNDLADGDYVFEVAGTNGEGRQDPTPASKAFSVGSTDGPTVAITSHPQRAQTDRTASFTFTGSTGGSTYVCRLVPWGESAPWEPCDPSGKTYLDLADGPYLFEVRAPSTESGQSDDSSAGWFFDVDNVGPVQTFTSRPVNPTGLRTARFRFVANETTQGAVSCSLDGRGGGCPRGRFQADGLTKGDHTLRVTAVDLQGNVGVTEFLWTVDLARPQVAVNDGPPVISSQSDAEFNLWSDADPALFLCRLDGSPLMPCFTLTVMSGLRDGAHRFTVYGLDVAMNRSEAATYRWRVDTIPPGLTLTGDPAQGADTSSTSAAFDVWQSEPGVIYCQIDAEGFDICTPHVAYSALAAGPHTFEAFVKDRAGNDSITASWQWTVSA